MTREPEPVREPVRLPPVIDAVRALLIAGAAAMAFHAWSLLRQDWGRNFDAAMRWDGIGILLLLVALAPLPPYRLPRPANVRSFVTRHYWEIAGLGIVLALGIFMRLYDIGHFPPSNGAAFEESQMGGDANGILRGNFRPINFAVADYTAVLGLKLFGYDMNSLRLPFLLAGILSLIPFYVLVRMLVSAPAALFATALLSVNRWHAFSVRIADELFSGMSLSILTTCLLIAALRTRNGLIVLAFALALGLLNYEYTGYRHIPFLLSATFVIALAFRYGREAWVRRRLSWPDLGRRWWLAPVFAIALFMTVSPIIVDGMQGSNAYYEGIQRHQSETEETSLFGLPSTWERNAKWSIEVFLPAGPGKDLTGPPLGEPGKRMLDPVTATLALAAMAYAVISFRRPYRLLFSLWFLTGLMVGGVLPRNFYIARFTALLPAMFVLIAFLIDDVWRLLPRPRARMAAAALLLGLTGWAFGANFAAFRSQADNVTVRQHFADPFFNLCAFAKELPPETHIYTWADTDPTHALFLPSDYSWICQSLDGEALASPAAVRPLDLPDATSVAFVYLTLSDSQFDPIAQLRAAYPEFAWRADKEDDPFGLYLLRAFVAPTSELARQRGLAATYLGASEPLERVDAAQLFVTGGDIDWPAGASEVRWEGLVLLERAGAVALVPSAPVPIEISVDGLPVYSASNEVPQALEAGWHTVSMTLAREAEDTLPSLVWRGLIDFSQPLTVDHLFASELRGWRHTISASVSYGETRTLRWQQIDTSPVIGSGFVPLPAWLAESEGLPPATDGSIVDETWQARWSVAADGRYVVEVGVRYGSVTVLLDGTAVAEFAGEPSIQEKSQSVPLDLTAGEHTVELRFLRNEGNIAGVSLTPPAGAVFVP